MKRVAGNGGTSYGGSIETAIRTSLLRWEILLFDSSGNLFGASCDEVYFNGGNIFEVVK